MQILLNHGVVGQAVEDHIRTRVVLEEGEAVHVIMTDEGATVYILPEGESPYAETNEDGTPSPTSEKPVKKTRRTKAQIEADNLAEEEARQAALAANAVTPEVKPENPKDPVDPVTPDEPANVKETASTSDTVVESNSGSDEQAPETKADPEPEVKAEPVVETKVAEAEPERKPTQSLFANLRKPTN